MVDFMKVFFKRIWSKKEILFLGLLTSLGLFLRFYRLEDLMVYLGDEGRDMLILMDIVQLKNFPFIGPPTSMGRLFLGPIYYYFITPFAWLFKMEPIGPAVFVALLGSLTIPLIYLVTKNFFDSITGCFAAILYTFSPLIITFSRSSWNPNPMPFFCLLLVLGLFYWQKTKKERFFYLSLFCFAVSLQLHYMVILLTPFLIFVFYKLRRNFKNKKVFLYGFLIFFLLLSPLLVFDLKHDFVNTKGVLALFKGRSNEGFSFYDLLSRSRDRLRQLFSLFFAFEERGWRTNLMVVSVLVFSFFDWFKQKKLTKLVIYGWFIWGGLSVGLYRHSFFPHYLGFLFPLPAIFLANVFKMLFNKGKLAKILTLTLFTLLLFCISKASWLYLSRPPTLNVFLIKKIVRLIEKQSQGKTFNFALLAKHNYDDSYRYFFKLWEIPVVYQTEVVDQLFVVCENEEICQPEGNPKWEIAIFDAAYQGQIERRGEWEPDPLIKVFKFIPQEDAKK